MFWRRDKTLAPAGNQTPKCPVYSLVRITTMLTLLIHYTGLYYLMSVFHRFLPEIMTVHSQKCHMIMGPILSGHGVMGMRHARMIYR